MSPVKNLQYDFLRRHYPHQVKGRSPQLPLSPLSRAPLSLTTLVISLRGLIVKMFVFSFIVFDLIHQGNIMMPRKLRKRRLHNLSIRKQ